MNECERCMGILFTILRIWFESEIEFEMGMGMGIEFEMLLTEPTSANFTHCEHSAHGQQCLTFACSTQEEELSRNALSCAAIAVVGEVVVERSAFTTAIAKTSVLLTIPDQNSYVWLHRTERTTEVVVKRGRRIRQREFRNCAGRMMITQSMIRWIRKG